MKRHMVHKFLLCFISALVCLIFIELVLRIRSVRKDYQTAVYFRDVLQNENLSEKKSYRRIHDYIYYDKDGCMRFVPNVEGVHKSYDDKEKEILIRINSEGFRGLDLLDSPEKRILFMGDSIVFDGGVTRENTFVHGLEEFLNTGRRNRKDFRMEVLNFGISDSGIDQYYLKLKHHGLSLKPDFVFLGFYLNDAVSPQGFMGPHSLDVIERFFESDIMRCFKLAEYMGKKYRALKYANLEEFKERLQWVPRYIQRRFYRDRDEFMALVKEAHMDWGAAWVPESWIKVKYYLNKIKGLCDRNDITLILFCFPGEIQVYSDIEWSEFDYPQRQIQKITEELGIPCFDLLPSLRAYRYQYPLSDHPGLNLDGSDNQPKQIYQYLFADHCHYNRTGNRALLDILMTMIEEHPEVFAGLSVH